MDELAGCLIALRPNKGSIIAPSTVYRTLLLSPARQGVALMQAGNLQFELGATNLCSFLNIHLYPTALDFLFLCTEVPLF